MTLSTTAGMAASWTATRVAPADQAVQTAMLKNQAEAEQSVVALVQPAAESKEAPPPPGQGVHVDRRA